VPVPIHNAPIEAGGISSNTVHPSFNGATPDLKTKLNPFLNAASVRTFVFATGRPSPVSAKRDTEDITKITANTAIALRMYVSPL
jgi:hypothetical protein